MRDPTVAWSSPDWLAEATDWIDERLTVNGARCTGPVEQPHLRPWATVLRVPTTGGPVWLKTAAPRTSSEVALYELLAREMPEHVFVPLAVDVARGWLLLPDGGTRHAFACRLLPLTDVRNRADEDAALRLRDAYLEAWSDLAPHAELVETLELAVRVGWIARSHTWLRAVGDATGDRWATAPLESLAGILDGP